MADTGYLEESPGVRSSTRLLAQEFYVLAALTVLSMIGYIAFVLVKLAQQPTGSALYGFAAVITALVGSGAYTQGTREGEAKRESGDSGHLSVGE